MKKYSYDHDFNLPTIANDLASDIVDYLNNGDYDNIEEAINETIDNAFIYYSDQWELLQAYFVPTDNDLNLYTAFEYLSNDIYSLIEEEEEEEDD